MAQQQEFLISAREDLQAARTDWLKSLARERRLSALTVEAYERDTRQFLQFLTGHNGGPPGIADIKELRPADLRAFLAFRRTGGAGARTLGRIAERGHELAPHPLGELRDRGDEVRIAGDVATHVGLG